MEPDQSKEMQLVEVPGSRSLKERAGITVKFYGASRAEDELMSLFLYSHELSQATLDASGGCSRKAHLYELGRVQAVCTRRQGSALPQLCFLRRLLSYCSPMQPFTCSLR